MDCQHCETLLLDLAYGELAPAEETAARTHLARCGHCASALERIQSGLSFARQLPIVEPPPGLADAALQAAAAQTQQAPAPPGRSLLEHWVTLVRRLAMARQVQMATVMLLIVLIGLWSVPELSRKREAQGGSVVGPDDGGEAGPSAALSPAQPLDLAVDRRTGRIRPKGEMAEPSPARSAAHEAPAAPAEFVAEAVPAGAATEPQAAIAATPTPADEGSAEMKRAAKVAADTDDVLGLGDSELAVHEFAPPPPAAAPAATMGPSADAPATSERTMRMRRSVSESPAGGMSAPSKAVSPYSQALERYRSGDFQEARDLFRSALASADASQRSVTLLYLARSEAALGRCSAALPHYDAIVQRYPAAPVAQAALAEAVGCYDTLRQGERATELLRRAAQVPALAAGANRLLQSRSGAGAASDQLR